MGEIINLRQYRKRKARTDKEKRAEENRVKFGRSKSARNLNTAQRNLSEKRLDAAQRELRGNENTVPDRNILKEDDKRKTDGDDKDTGTS